jgi:hypothetical protein
MSHLAMFDLTPVRFIQLGAGVGVDYGRFGLCEGSGNSLECNYSTGNPQLGAEGRFAFIIPLPGVRARWGIPIALHYHVTFFENRQIHTITAASGLIRF